MPKAEDYLKELKGNVNYAKDFSLLARFTGPKLTLYKDFTGAEELGSIEIAVDKEHGITEELIQAVTLGSYIDKENMDRTSTATGMGEVDYFFMNVLEGANSPSHTGRDEDFQMVMYEGRKNAKKALLEYASTGDRTLIDKYLNNLSNYAIHQGMEHTVSTSSAGQVMASFYDLIIKTKDEYKNPPISDLTLSKMNEQLEINRNYQEVLQAKIRLLEEKPEVGTKAREEYVLKIIRGMMIEKLTEAFTNEAVSEIDKNARDIFTKKDYIDGKLTEAIKKDLPNFKMSQDLEDAWKEIYIPIGTVSALYGAGSTVITYQADMLKNDENRKAYYEKLDQTIKTTDLYQKLMQETDQDKIAEMIKDFNLKDLNVISKVNGKEVSEKFKASDLYPSEDAGKNYIVKDEKIKKEYIDAFEAGAIRQFRNLVVSPTKKENKENPEDELKESLLDKSIRDYIRENNLNVDLGIAFTRGSHEMYPLTYTCTFVKENDNAVFVKNKNGGVTQFEVEITADGVKVSHRNLPAVPYKKFDYVGEKYPNRFNAEIARIDAENNIAGFTEAYGKLPAYLNILTGAAAEAADMPKSYGDMLAFAQELSGYLQEIYRTEPDGRVKTLTKEQCDRMNALYEKCIEAAEAYAKDNPFDECAKAVKGILQRDQLAIENARAAGKENDPAQIALEVSNLQKEAEKNKEAKAKGQSSPEWTASIKEPNIRQEQAILRHAGSKPDMTAFPDGAERFNRTEIIVDPASGITEQVVQAITLGAFLDDESLKRQDVYNRGIDPHDYLFMNVLTDYNDSRDASLHMPLFEARMHSQEAIADYKTNPERLNRYADNLVKYICGVGLYHPVSFSSEGQMFYSLYKLVLDVADTPAFKGKFPEKVLNKCREKVEIRRQKVKALEAEKKLSENLPEIYTKERRELLLDAITGNLIEQLSESYNEDLQNTILTHSMFQDINKNDPAYINASPEEKQQMEREHMASDQYYKDFVLPLVYKYFPEDYRQQTELNMEIQWKGASIIQGILLENDYIKYSSDTYQTEMLLKPETREKYYHKIRDMVESSDIFKRLMMTANPDDLKEKLASIKLDHNKIKPVITRVENGKIVREEKKTFSVDDIPDTDAEKKILSDKRKEEEKTIDMRLPEAERLAFDLMEKDLKHQSETIVLSKIDKLGKKIQKALEDYIKDYELNADINQFYLATSSKPEMLSTACYKVARNNAPIYIGNRDGGVYKFDVKVDKDENITVTDTSMSAVPYETMDYIKNRFVNATNYDIAKHSLLEDKPEYIETYRKIRSYVTVMESAKSELKEENPLYDKVVDSLKNAEEILTKLYKTEKKTDAAGFTTESYYKASAEELSALDSAFADCQRALDNYFTENPYDKLVNDLRSTIKTDREFVFDLAEELEAPVSLAQIALTHRDERQREEHPELREKHKDNAHLKGIYAGAAHIDNLEVNNLTISDALCRQLLENTLGDEFALDDKGDFIKDSAGSYLQLNGEWFTPAMLADFLEHNREEIIEFRNNNFKSSRELHEEKSYNLDEAREYLKSKKLEHLMEKDEDIPQRQAASRRLEKQYFDQLMDLDMGILIAKAGRTAIIPREINRFLEPGNTEDVYRKNSETIGKMLSGDASQKREVYEQILEKCDGLVGKIEEFSLEKDELLQNEETTGRLIDFALKAVEIQNVFSNAIAAGVNVYDDKYEKLRSMATTIETIGFTWIRKIEKMIHPSYDFLDLKKFADMKTKDIEKLYDGQYGELSEQFVDGLFLIHTYYDDTKRNQKNWMAKTENRPTYMDCVRHSRKIFKTFESIDPTDQKLVEFRDKLVSNVRKTLGIKRDNSERYNKVIRAIDEYRLASSVKKEIYRKKLENACASYVTHRGASKERTKLIYSLGKFVHSDVRTQALKVSHMGRLPVARKMVDTYELMLENNEGKETKKAFESLQNKKFKDMLIDEIADTLSCRDIAESKQDMPLVDYAEKCCKAVREVSSQKSGYSVADAKLDGNSANVEVGEEVMKDLAEGYTERNFEADMKNAERQEKKAAEEKNISEILKLL